MINIFVAYSYGTFEGTWDGKLEGSTLIDDKSKYDIYDIQLCNANGILDNIRDFFCRCPKVGYDLSKCIQGLSWCSMQIC